MQSQNKNGAAAAAAPSAASAQPPEDSVQDGGNAIDTFSSYVPTALPKCVVDALRETSTSADVLNTQHDVEKKNSEPEVIELSDSDDDELEIIDVHVNTSNEVKIEDKVKQSATKEEEDAKSLFINSSIQSHTSPAVESALLASVSAPPVSNSDAAVVLPLVKEGKLSPLQAEGVCLAVNRFRRVFTGERGSVRAGELLLFDGSLPTRLLIIA
jgi:hypothetical protein